MKSYGWEFVIGDNYRGAAGSVGGVYTHLRKCRLFQEDSFHFRNIHNTIPAQSVHR